MTKVIGCYSHVVFCYVWRERERQRLTERHSPAGFEENCHGVNGPWTGPHVKEQAGNCVCPPAKQPVGSQGPWSYRQKQINSVNSLNKLESRFFSSQASSKTPTGQHLDCSLNRGSVMPRLLVQRKCEVIKVCCFKPLYLH